MAVNPQIKLYLNYYYQYYMGYIFYNILNPQIKLYLNLELKLIGQ